MKEFLSIVFWGTLLSVSSAFSLDIRDQTCPDGGICLDIDSNVCCEGGPYGGCMFSTGVCCQNGYFCYEGHFCSTTNPAADDSSGLDTNCCQDEACSTVIGLAPFVIPYDQQPFYSGASGSGEVMTSMGSAPIPTGSTDTVTSGTKSQSPTTPTKGGTPTTTTPSASAASPSASKTSVASDFKEGNILRVICVFFCLGSLILLF